MRKIIITIGLLILAFVLVFMIDPGFKKTIKFGDYSIDYNWYIFDNAYCNWRTHGHCDNNNFNKINAELKLWKTLAENYNGEKNIKKELENIIQNRYNLHMTYTESLKIGEVEIDSIIKHKDLLFKQLYIY